MQEINEYKVLARKYRPQKFSNLVGQDQLVEILKNSIVNISKKKSIKVMQQTSEKNISFLLPAFMRITISLSNKLNRALSLITNAGNLGPIDCILETIHSLFFLSNSVCVACS